jgi:hypothetical protein
MVVFRLRASSSGFWLSSHHIQRSKLALMQSSTRWLAETIGRVRRMSSDFRTFAPSSKRYAVKSVRICSLLTSRPSGVAYTRAILGNAATLFDGRLCIQRDVHPKEYGDHSELLRHSSQRGEVPRLVRNSILLVALVHKLRRGIPQQIPFQP